MMMKVILTDADGVLLNWEYAFHIWMKHRGYAILPGDSGRSDNIAEQYGMHGRRAGNLILEFNESAAIGFLPAFRDAQQYATDLWRKHGYRFIVVTSVSDDPNVQELRTQNLYKLFVPDMFLDVICLPCGGDKFKTLWNLSRAYDGAWWVEDMIHHAVSGERCGFRPILMEHGYNMNCDETIPIFDCWRDIYYHIVENDTDGSE
jgi:hypothetical protein